MGNFYSFTSFFTNFLPIWRFWRISAKTDELLASIFGSIGLIVSMPPLMLGTESEAVPRFHPPPPHPRRCGSWCLDSNDVWSRCIVLVLIALWPGYRTGATAWSRGHEHIAPPLSGASTIRSGAPNSGRPSQSTVSGKHHCQGNSLSGAPSKSGTSTKARVPHGAYHNVGFFVRAVSQPTPPKNSGSGPQKMDFIYKNNSITTFPLPAASWGSLLGFCGIKNHQAVSTQQPTTVTGYRSNKTIWNNVFMEANKVKHHSFTK